MASGGGRAISVLLRERRRRRDGFDHASIDNLGVPDFETERLALARGGYVGGAL